MNGFKTLALAGLFLLGGCYKVTYTNGPSGELQRNNPALHHVGILGLVEFSAPIPVHSICPNGFDRVDVRSNVLTGLISNVTQQLYTPLQTFVQCKSGSAYLIDVDENGAVAEALELDMQAQ
jgi:hypothetical protein